MDISDEELMEEQDCSDPAVLNKYNLAGTVASQVLGDIITEIDNGARDVALLCAAADQRIVALTTSSFKKVESKGAAFPTCISKNELAGHFSPIEEGNLLVDGDLVKIDLGVQIDGFAALVATTFQVGGGNIEGRKADCLAAAWTSAECAIRMMKPGVTNEQITEMFQTVATDFDCNCLEGVLSHELKRFVIDGENTILAKPSPERQVETFELEPNKVYAIDCVMSTGEGRAIRKDEHQTTIYKRVVENQYNLKSKFSRSLLKTINSDYPTYPFSLRNFENLTRARAGVRECLNNELLADYPVLHERQGEYIAQFKFTVVVRPNAGPLRTCGTKTLNKDIIQTDKQLQNEDLIKLMSETWETQRKKKKKKKKKSNK